MKMLSLFIFLTTTAMADSSNYLRMKAYRNLESRNCEDLDKPKTFKVDADFVVKNRCLDFRIFLEQDEVEEVCFVGKPSLALEAIDEILAIATGNAYVYPSNSSKVTKNLVSRPFKYEDEGGDSSESATVLACKI